MRRSLATPLLLALAVACVPPSPATGAPGHGLLRALGPAAPGDAGALVPAPAMTAPLDRAFIRTLSVTHNFRLGMPNHCTVTADGSAVLFLRSEPRDVKQSLYKVDVKSGDERLLASADQVLKAPEHLTPEERARRERMRVTTTGFTSFELTKDELGILLPLSGHLFFFDRLTGKTRALATGDGVLDPHFSPDGKRVAYVRNSDVFAIDVAEGAKEEQITRGGTDAKPHGVSEFASQEEFDRDRGFYFSPDGQQLAFEEADQSKVETLSIADPAHPENEPDKAFYPRAGKTNADVRFGLVSTHGGVPVWVQWDRQKFPYVAKVTWDTGAPLTFWVLDRAQQNGQLLATDAKTGATRVLLTEHDDAWLNVDTSVPRWLADGKSFLWSTERDGAWALELRTLDGAGTKARTLLPAGKGYREVADLDGEKGIAQVKANADPTLLSLVTISVADGVVKPRYAEAGYADAVFGNSHVAFVAYEGFLDQYPHLRVVSPMATRDLMITAERPSWLPNAELRTAGAEKTRVAVIRPRTFVAGRKYPVLDSAYGGPGVTLVARDAFRFIRPQFVADSLDAIVVDIDAQGTPWRDRAWERALRGKMATTPVEGHVAALRALAAENPEMDLGRVGVFGWSFGGYFSAAAVLLRPEIYKVGVAGAAPSDWRAYDTAYTERYLGMPDVDKVAYDAASLLMMTKIESPVPRPLLLLHGTADDNVYFNNSLQLAEALARAGKLYELVPLIGQTHLVRDPEAAELQWIRTLEFLRDHLVSGEATTQYPHYL